MRLFELGDLNDNRDVVKAFETLIVSLDHYDSPCAINGCEWYCLLVEVRNKLDVQIFELNDVALVYWQRYGQLSLTDRVLDRSLDIKSHQVNDWLQVEVQTERLNVFHVVLLVVTSYKLEIVSLFLRHRVLAALDLYVGLGLLGTLNLDEIRGALFFVRCFLDLVSQSFIGRVSGHRHFIDLINAQRVHPIELSGSSNKLELRLGFNKEDCLPIRDTQSLLCHIHCDFVSALVTVLAPSNSDSWFTSFRIHDGR